MNGGLYSTLSVQAKSRGTGAEEVRMASLANEAAMHLAKVKIFLKKSIYRMDEDYS